MSRKEIPGRAALSFPAIEGLLDMDQILETDPWNRINDFVQENFMQNILDEFSDRMKLNPKLTPQKGDAATGKNRATSSSKKTRKSQTSRANEEKSTEQKDDNSSADGSQGSKKTRNKRGDKRANDKQEERDADEEAKNKVKRKSEPKSRRESSKTSNASKYQQESENVFETNAKVNSAAKRTRRGVKRTANIVEETQTAGTETGNVTINKNETTMISTSQSINLQLPINTSTPKCKQARVNDFAEKEQAENNASESKKSLFASSNASSKKCRVKDVRAKKDLNDNWAEITIVEKAEKKSPVKCKRETGKNARAKIKGEIVNDKVSRSSAIKRPSRCNDRDEKIATTSKKKAGKYEQRLLDKRKKRQERKIRRHERKAERAMEEFGRHVTRIVREMGYLPESGSSSSSDYDFSDESSSSGSCCSYSTCSCCSCTCSSCSCSDEYSEYTLCSFSSES